MENRFNEIKEKVESNRKNTPSFKEYKKKVIKLDINPVEFKKEILKKQSLRENLQKLKGNQGDYKPVDKRTILASTKSGYKVAGVTTITRRNLYRLMAKVPIKNEDGRLISLTKRDYNTLYKKMPLIEKTGTKSDIKRLLEAFTTNAFEIPRLHKVELVDKHGNIKKELNGYVGKSFKRDITMEKRSSYMKMFPKKYKEHLENFLLLLENNNLLFEFEEGENGIEDNKGKRINNGKKKVKDFIKCINEDGTYNLIRLKELFIWYGDGIKDIRCIDVFAKYYNGDVKPKERKKNITPLNWNVGLAASSSI